MPLVTCPDCLRKVSDRAPACVHCGVPMAQEPVPAILQQIGKHAAMTSSGKRSPDDEVWRGGPSHWTGLFVYGLGALLVPFGIGIVIILWQYFAIRCTNYRFGAQRLTVRTGILSRTTEEVELFRVLDFRLDEPFTLRLFGLATITVVTADQTASAVTLRAISGAPQVLELLRQCVASARGLRRTVSLETF